VRKIVLVSAAGLALAGLGLAPLGAQSTTTITSGGLSIEARFQEHEGDRAVVSGTVVVRYRNIILFADKAELNTKTKDVVASGNVTVHLPREVITGEVISGNLDTVRFKVEKALGFIQPTIRYASDLIERKSDNLYSFQKPEITTCTQPTPRWKFSCSRANFKKDDYIEMWNAVVSVKKVPILYLPYLRYPLDQERATGFLTPQIGYSQTKGFIVSEDFYWTIARNMDATFSLDYYSAKGFGGGLRYRYVFRDGTAGEASLYYFSYKKPSIRDGDASLAELPASAIVRVNHSQALPLGFNLVAAVDYQNSFDFLKEFDNNIRRALVFNRSSQVFLTKAWASYNFSLRAARFETYFPFFGGSDFSIINEYLPQISFSAFKQRLFKPVFFSFTSGFHRWRFGSKDQFANGKPLTGQSLSLTPTLTVPFNSIPWVNVDFALEGAVNYYFNSFSYGTRDMIDEPMLTAQYAASLDLVGPVFERIWDLGENRKLKHIIEPAVSYRYESPVSAYRQIVTPYFFYRVHQLSYGLTNRLLLKKGDSRREILTWGLSQDYYLSPTDSPLWIYAPYNGGVIPRFSEVGSYVRFFPKEKLSFDFSLAYNTYKSRVPSLRLSATLGAPSDNVFLSVSWFKSAFPWYEVAYADRHQVGFAGGLKVPRLNLEALGEAEFNIGERKLLYAGGSFVYHYQCLDFKGEIRIFNFRDKPEIQCRLSLGLGNIGKTTDFLGGLDLK
jgi:lipopolysaccharide assembly outer membrane protein LptD (OstA)